PCVDTICAADEYARAVDMTQLFLEGKNEELVKTLRTRMLAAADGERYEEAAQLRDAMRTVQALHDRQQKMATAELGHRDVFGLQRGPAGVAVQICPVRSGRGVERGEKRGVVDLANRNAALAYQTRFNQARAAQYDALETLQHVLSLPTLPRRIECFDISTIQGSETVASMVVCEDGRMRRSDYRKYRIRGVGRSVPDRREGYGPSASAGGDEVALRRSVPDRREGYGASASTGGDEVALRRCVQDTRERYGASAS